MVSIILSKLAHEFVEKPLIKLCDGYRNLVIILVILYTSTIVIPTQLAPASGKVSIHFPRVPPEAQQIIPS